MRIIQKNFPRANIIVADDHPVVLVGISKMIEDVPGLRLVATATKIPELFIALEQSPCDLLICDYSFEDDDEPDGLLLLERIRRFYPQLKIILMTSHDDIAIVQRAMHLGIAGFLSKISGEFSDLPNVISKVLNGENFVDSTTSKVLVQHIMANSLSNTSLSTFQLTARELEVVRLFSNGMSVTDIASYTDRSVKTISTQKKKAMLKFGASNDVELLNIFNQLF